jgi:hypothetical protein
MVRNILPYQKPGFVGFIPVDDAALFASDFDSDRPTNPGTIFGGLGLLPDDEIVHRKNP